MRADTGRRCPRCDCADGHEQCEHCKVCEHARPWCCNGRAAECPLCDVYGTSVLDRCPGHPADDATAKRVQVARLHAQRAHPGWEYRTTEGPRKQWDRIDEPPADDEGEPDPTWERNVDAGRPGQGWDRFDYTEESYWRRPKRTAGCARPECGGVVHTDPWGTPVQCPHTEPDPAAQLAFAREYARVQRDHWQRRLDELDQQADASKEMP